MLLTCGAPRFASFSLPKRLAFLAAVWLGCLWCFFGSLATAQANQTITGKVHLEDSVYPLTIPSLIPKLSFSFVSETNGATVSCSAPMSSSGAYSFNLSLPADTYSVGIKAPEWLQVVQKHIVIAANATINLADVSLLAGDAVEDNFVDSSDFGLFIGAFGGDITLAGSGYDPHCDFNCDGAIDSSDFALLIGNFGRAGDSLYTVILSSDQTSLVGGGSVQITLRFSGGAPLASSENLRFDCSQTQAATYTVGTISSPLENRPAVALQGYPASSGQTERWSVDSDQVYTYQTTFTIHTSSVNYPTPITIYGTFLNARGAVTLHLLPSNFRVENISMTTPGPAVPSIPKTHLVWDTLPSLDANQYPLFVKRDDTVIYTVAYNSGAPVTSCDDTPPLATLNSGMPVTYRLVTTPYPSNASPIQIGADKVQLYKTDASANQAVDSRLDLRYAAPTFQNFQFGTRTYRGGLFAGHATDPARVGHSLIRFPLDASAQPANTSFRIGNVNAYFTGALTDTSQISSTVTSETMVVQCQQTQYDIWNPLSVVWANSPKVDTTLTDYNAQITYTPATPNPQWVAWNMTDAIKTTLQSSTDQQSSADLSVLLHGQNESDTANLWAYFAKKEYDASVNLAPCVLYALTFPVPARVDFPALTAANPIAVYGDFQGTVAVSGLGIGDSVDVTLTAPNQTYISFGEFNSASSNMTSSRMITDTVTLHVTGFNNPATFTLHADQKLLSSPLAFFCQINVTATCNGVSATGKISFQYSP